MAACRRTSASPIAADLTDPLRLSRGASVIAGVMVDAIRAGVDEGDVEAAVLLALQEAH